MLSAFGQAVRTMSRRAPLAFLTAVVVCGAWLGCASSEEDGILVPGGPEEPAATSTSPTKPDPGQRPAFEAGFEDAGEPDPTPDGGDVCIDTPDQGSTETTATALPDTDDSQNSPITVNGVLSSAVDVDYFKISMTDKSFHFVEPELQILTSGVEMCVFVKCKAGETTVSACAGGAVKKNSDIGTQGCCVTGPAAPTPTWDCPGLSDNDSADFFVRVKQTAPKCQAYSWTYRF